METGNEEAIFSPAIVEEVKLGHRYVEVQFRGRRDKFLGPRRRSYKMNVIWLSDDTSAKNLFCAAQKLCPGDEIWVEINHESWYNPRYRNIFRRGWNLLFG